MKIRVLFFGTMKDMAGTSADAIDLPESSSVRNVIEHYANRIPKFAEFVAYCAASVNQEYALPEKKLKAGDEVAFLPPVSGGGPGDDRAAIVREKIETPKWLARITQPCDGAAIAFEGVVRDNTRGRRTLHLDYEAYEPMAIKQMVALVDEAKSQFEIRDAIIVHRLGRLQVSETSVLIVVASAHRAAAFEACRWLIDTLKRTVPIWKKEYFEDGAVWADGEPFPDDLLTSGSSRPKQAASK